MRDVIDPQGAPCDALTIPHNSNLGGGGHPGAGLDVADLVLAAVTARDAGVAR